MLAAAQILPVHPLRLPMEGLPLRPWKAKPASTFGKLRLRRDATLRPEAEPFTSNPLMKGQVNEAGKQAGAHQWREVLAE